MRLDMITNRKIHFVLYSFENGLCNYLHSDKEHFDHAAIQKLTGHCYCLLPRHKGCILHTTK